MFSSRLFVSNAKDDMVVKEPQNPMAMRKEYFVSKFRISASTENSPKTKLPIMLTTKTLTGKPDRVRGDSTIL